VSEPVALKTRHVVELLPTAPFNFDATMHKPDHFPSADNAWEPGIRWQTMLWQNKTLGLKLENLGSIDQPRVALAVWAPEKLSPAFLAALADEIGYRYNLPLDLTEFNRRFRDDAQLGPIIARWRGLRPACYCSLYEYLIVAIVLQNATVRRSVNMLQALYEHYGTLLAYDGQELYCSWPPEALSTVTEDELRALKVGYRAKSIIKVTAPFVRQEIDEFELRRQSRDEQRKALLGLYGIGPASVDYLLSDVFHRLDEMSHISPWEQKIYSKLFCGVDPERPVPVDTLLAVFKERFGGYRSLAVHYVWEDLFWKRQHEHVAWLEKLIRL